MEMKTQVHAEDGKQDLVITRLFDLPAELVFKAYTEPELLEEWMGTKVLRLENKPHGSYRFETTDPQGNKYGFNGTIHQYIPNEKITRTFEFENTPFGVQLEFLEFEALSEGSCRLTIHSIFRTAAQRDRQLQMPFKQGLNMAHERLEAIVNKLKQQS